MDIRKRLTRGPLTAIFWLLLTTVMALLLGVGSSLMYASGSMSGIMDEHHTSIAMRTDSARIETMTQQGLVKQNEEKLFTQEDLDYFMSMPSVEGVYFHTLSAGYSPSFRPLVSGSMFGEETYSYNQIAVLGEVTKLYGQMPYSPYQDNEEETRVRVYGTMKVEQILSHSPNYTGFSDDSTIEELTFEIVLVRQEDGAYIQEGQRYILLTEYDPHFLGSVLQDGTELARGPYVTNNNTQGAVLTDKGLVRNTMYLTPAPAENPADDQLVMVQVEGTLEEFLADPANAQWAWFLESSHKQNRALPVLGTEALDTFHAFVNYDATMTQGRFFTQEEYDTGARVCILSETLAESSGIALGDTITMSQFACHGGNSLGYINESVSAVNDGMMNNPGLGLLTYREFEPEEEFTVVGLYRLRNQWADTSYSFTPNTVFIPQKAQMEGAFGGMSNLDIEISETDPYYQTIVKRNQRMGGTYGIYFTMKLKNGMVADFVTALEGTPHQGQYLTLDQGFDAVQKTLDTTADSTRTLFLAVALGWVLMAALYVLLYQGRQNRNVGIMLSLGAGKKQAQNYLWGSGMMVCGLGIAVGTVITALTMNLVQNKLLEATFGVEANRYSVAGLSEDAVSTMITQSQLPLWVIVAAAAAQLLILGVILYLQARAMSRKSPRKLLGK